MLSLPASVVFWKVVVSCDDSADESKTSMEVSQEKSEQRGEIAQAFNGGYQL